VRILSIDSSRGTRLLLVQATVADDGTRGAGPKAATGAGGPAGVADVAPHTGPDAGPEGAGPNAPEGAGLHASPYTGPDGVAPHASPDIPVNGPGLPAAGARVRLEILVAEEQDDPRRHAESLGPMLRKALGDPGSPAARLDAVVAATGPAPFTGLRAGLVTARVVCRARGVPLYGVPSLDAVARTALDEAAAQGAQAGTTVLVLTDARRKEVYAATYRARGADDVERLSDLHVLPPEQALSLADGHDHLVLAGSGAVLYPSLAHRLGVPVHAPVSGDAASQVRLALARVGRGEELGSEPLYLRHADVHVPGTARRAR